MNFSRLFSFMKNDFIPEEFKDIQSLRSQPDNYFIPGKKVKVINNLKYIKYVQENNGGWVDDMIYCLGKICTICEVDYEKLILIKTSTNKQWLFHRAAFEEILEKTKNKSPENKYQHLFSTIEKGDIFQFNKFIKKETINIRNKVGQTPINLACCVNNKVIVDFLCGFGADINIPDNFGNCPIYNCAVTGNVECLKILKKAYPQEFYTEFTNLFNIAKRNGNRILETFLLHEFDEESIKGFTLEKQYLGNPKSFTKENMTKNEKMANINYIKQRPFSESSKISSSLASNSMKRVHRSQQEHSMDFSFYDPPVTLNQPITNTESFSNLLSISEHLETSTLKLKDPPVDHDII